MSGSHYEAQTGPELCLAGESGNVASSIFLSSLPYGGMLTKHSTHIVWFALPSGILYNNVFNAAENTPFWLEALAAKSDNLNLIPVTHVVEGRNLLLHIAL